MNNISDWHRHLVTKHYAQLLRRFGLPRTLRAIRKLKLFVWTKRGLSMLEKREDRYV